MKKLLIIIGVVAALAGVGTTLSAKSSLYTTPNCGSTAVVKCGTFNQKQLNAGLTKDVKAVYSKYGIDTNLSAAKEGTLKANGDVIVGGKVVATGAQSIGRNAKSGTTTVTIGGKQYHIHSAKSAFLGYDTPVFVFFNKDGSFRGAIAKVCGNPIIAKPVPVPAYECKNVAVKTVTRTSFSFSSTHSVKNATYKSTTYTVRDANGKIVQDGTKSTFSTTKAGNYTVQATITVTVDGKTKTTTSNDCKAAFTVKPEPVVNIKVCDLTTKKIITIDEKKFDSKKHSKNLDDCKPAVYSCDSLTAKIANRTDATFTGKATAKDGATVVNYSFDFGDGKKATVTNPVGVKHTYAAPGTYTVTMSVTVKVNGVNKTITDTKCATKVTVEKPPVIAVPAYTCDDLAVKITNRTDATFTGKATATNGAVIKSYSFNFGDGTTTTVTNPVGVKHTYAKEGTYTAKLSVTVTVNGTTKTVTDASCETKVTIPAEEKPPVTIVVCDLTSKETITINEEDFDNTKHSKDLNDCKEVPPVTPPVEEKCDVPGKEHLPKDSKDCVETPVTELPTTGIGDFMPLLGAGSLIAAASYYVASRRLI